jgi:tetratricopeptide (TPR) repeat protein
VAALAIVTLIAVSAVLFAKIVRERDEARSTFALLKETLESVDPRQLNRELTVVDLLDGASARIDKSPPERRTTEAAVREILGNVYRNIGNYDRSGAALEKALTIRRDETRGDSVEVADTLHNLAATRWWEGKYAEAEPLYQESLDMKRRLFRGDHPSIAITITHLAACRLRQNQLSQARALYDEALAMQKRIHGEESPEVAAAINNVAKCELDAERYSAAERLFRQALAMITKLKGPDDSGTASASQNLGDCLNRQSAAAALRGDTDAADRAAGSARDAFTAALAIRTRMYPRGHHLVAASLCGLSRAQLLLGDITDAETNARTGLEMYQRTRKPDHPDIADGLEVWGSVLLAKGDAGGACAAMTEAVRMVAASRPPAEGQLISLRTLLGRAELQAGRLPDAETHLQEALVAARKLRGDRSHATMGAARALFELYSLRHDAAKAAQMRALAESGS